MDNAQTASNQQTALYNFGLDNPTVNTPLGSSSFSVGNTTPTYNYDAYNQAMAAYNAQPSSGPPSVGSLNAQQQNQYALLARGGSQAQQNYLNSLGTSSGSAGTAPTLSQFETSAGGQPQATQDITLSPQEQQLLGQSQQQQLAESNIATGLEGEVSNSLNTPVATSADFNQEAGNASNAYYNSQMAYLQPQQATTQEQLNNQLANQGIATGSDAYNTAEDANARQNTFADQQAQNNAILNGTQNAQQLFSLSSAAQELPLNEYSALMSGSQASMPNFGSVNPVSAQPTNVQQSYQNQYAGQTNAYNQQMAQQNSLTSGLFGLGGAGLGAYGQYQGLQALAAAG